MDKEFLYEIIISEQAEKNLDKIVAYLLSEWNVTVKDRFLVKFKKILKLLAINPYLFQVYSIKMQIRRCLITKHNAMYYRIVDNRVEIITIHDTRRNPNTLKL